MPKTKIQDWDTTAANNTDLNSINIDEGWAPANINNALREMMAQWATALIGADDGVVTGTAGANGSLVAWNADGDAVQAGTIVGTYDFSGATVTDLVVSGSAGFGGAGAGDFVEIGGQSMANLGAVEPRLVVCYSDPTNSWSASGGTEVLVARDSDCFVTVNANAISTAGIQFADPDDENAGAVYYDHATDALEFRAAAATRADITSGGLALATGARVNTIETTLTNDDTHIPTSAAVKDYVDGAAASWELVATEYSGASVSEIVLTDFDEAYDYRVIIEELIASAVPDIEYYYSGDAAYTSGTDLVTSPGTPIRCNITIDIFAPRRSKRSIAATSSFTALDRNGSGSTAGVISAGWNRPSANEPLADIALRARIANATFSGGNVYLFRRRHNLP